MSEQSTHDTSALSAIHLLHRAGQCADEIFSTVNSSNQLTPRQFEVLRTVAVSDEPSQTFLVVKTGIDRSTLADIVRRLVERGLLLRSRTRTDARRYAVALTNDGRRALSEAEPIVAATNERLLEAIPEVERQEFLNSLDRIINSVEAANTSTKPRV
ncbi:MAG: MarR family winged helix-turn-helix transcriptional regulator [Pseudomonadota bacterium]